VLAGILLGLPVALAAARLTQSLLFGLSVTDPQTLAAATATMIAIGTSAGLVPGWRAVRVQPSVVLRHE
jgi:putative ABC transport system permease protein